MGDTHFSTTELRYFNEKKKEEGEGGGAKTTKDLYYILPQVSVLITKSGR